MNPASVSKSRIFNYLIFQFSVNILQDTQNVKYCLLFSTFELVLILGNYMDKFLQFTWQCFWYWFTIVFFLGLRERAWP